MNPFARSIKDLFKKPLRSLTDPVFGDLTFHPNHGWEGKLKFFHLETDVNLMIAQPDRVPNDEDRSAFIDFRARYPGLLHVLGDRMFELFKPELDAGLEPPPGLVSFDGAGMLQVTRLELIDIGPAPRISLLYGFKGDYWPGAHCILNVFGDEVRTVSKFSSTYD